MGAIRFEFIGETSRETSKSGSAVHRYIMQYEDVADFDPYAAEIFVLTRTGTTLKSVRPLIRKSLTWEPLASYGPRYHFGFYVNINYGVPDKDSNGKDEEPLRADSVTSTPVKRLLSRRFYGEDETIKVDMAKKTRRFWANSPEPVEVDRVEGYGNMVRPTKEGPEGIDIPISRFAWEENWSFPRNTLTDAYILSIPDLKHHTNQNPFRGFKANEVLLADWSVDDPVPQSWEEQRTSTVSISFKFLVEPSASNLKIGDVSDINKIGWELITPIFREKISSDQTSSTFEVIAVLAQEVYDKADFSRLRIT